jgi:hypothetical protein
VLEESKSWNWNKRKTTVKSIEPVSDNEENDNIELEEETNEEVHNDENVNDEVVSDSTEEQSIEENDDGSPRTRRPPRYLRDYVTGLENSESENLAIAMFSSSEDPTTFDEAVKSTKWKEAMDSEIKSIEANNTWKLVTLPHGVKPIGVKWIYKTKYNEKGKIEKHKARLVAKGYSQKYGVDFSEVYAPVARWDTIRTILSLAAHEKWNVFQLDVKSAFLHGELIEDVCEEAQ